METNRITIAVAVLALLAGGWWLLGTPAPAHEAIESEEAHMAMGEHEHYEVPEGVSAPSISLSATKDSVKGWNLHLETANFAFAPERAGGAHIDGEGHAHLYVDNVKIGRVYGPWAYLGELPAGTHVISVSLATNDHRDYVAGGVELEASVEVTEPEMKTGSTN